MDLLQTHKTTATASFTPGLILQPLSAHTHAYPVPCYTPIKKHKSPIHLPDFVFIVNLEALFLHTTD